MPWLDVKKWPTVVHINVQLAFEKQSFTEWIFPSIVAAVIVALRRLPARGLFE